MIPFSESVSKSSAMPLDQLIRHLHINVMSKKNKNVEVLQLAAEVGVRLPWLPINVRSPWLPINARSDHHGYPSMSDQVTMVTQQPVSIHAFMFY